MDVSVIIINYKTPQLVIECVRSIFEKTLSIAFEIIVVDNNSADGSDEKIRRELGGKIKLIESKTNLGFGKANNLGAQYAKGEYLFLLNSDTLLINNAIKILYDFIKSNSQIGIAGGNLYTLEKTASPSYSLEFENLEDVKLQSQWKNIILDRIKKSKLGQNHIKQTGDESKFFNYSDRPMRVAYIFGADMMISKKVFVEFNGFDPDFFMYAEEAELAWRITNGGYQIWNTPHAKILHLDGGSTKKEISENQYRMRQTGRLTYFYKRYGHAGCKEFYFYKKLALSRTVKIAKFLRRKALMEGVEKQLKLLDEVYIEFQQTRLGYR